MSNPDRQLDPFLIVPGALPAIDLITEMLLNEAEPITAEASKEQELRIKKDVIAAGVFESGRGIQTKLYLAYKRGEIIANEIRLSRIEPEMNGEI